MIKGIIDGNTSQANAVAVTVRTFPLTDTFPTLMNPQAALFAGILATIAQTLPPDQNSSKHKALQFFIVSAIVVNVSGAAYALFALFALAQIPNYTASQIVKKPTSLAYKVAMGGTLPPKLIGTDEFMLAAFHPDARALIWAGTGVVTTCWFGSILTFVAITLWIWLQYDTVVAGATMIFLVPCCASLLWIIYGNISSMWKLVDIDWEERYKDIE